MTDEFKTYSRKPSHYRSSEDNGWWTHLDTKQELEKLKSENLRLKKDLDLLFKRVKKIENSMKGKESEKDTEKNSNQCPSCGSKADPVFRRGSELDRDAMYDAASTQYHICPACNHVYSYTF